MKRGWEIKKLEEVLDVVRNGVNCKQNKNGIGDKISRIESISSASFDINKVGYTTLSKSDKDKYRLKKGDILFSHINSPIHVGKTAQFNSDDEVYHGVNLLLMRPKPLLDNKYFEHYLKFLFQNGYWLGLCKQSVNQASVNQQDINKVEITFPKSIPEQQHIVTILDEAFASIARAKANAEQNLKNAKELFESYLQSVFTKKQDGWEEKSLGEIATVKGGKRVPKGYRLQTEPTNYPYIRVTDFNDDGSIDMNDLHYVSEDIFNQIKNYTISSKDLYISIAGTIGKTGIIPKELEGANLTENACKLVFNEGIDPKLIYYFTKSGDFLKQAGINTRVAAMPKLALIRLSTIHFSIPKSLKQQQIIVQKLDAFSAETKKLESIYQQKLTDFEELKKSLLQRTFNGELKTA